MAAANWRPEPLTSVSHYTEVLGLLMFDKQSYRLTYIEISMKDRKYFNKENLIPNTSRDFKKVFLYKLARVYYI